MDCINHSYSVPYAGHSTSPKMGNGFWSLPDLIVSSNGGESVAEYSARCVREASMARPHWKLPASVFEETTYAIKPPPRRGHFINVASTTCSKRKKAKEVGHVVAVAAATGKTDDEVMRDNDSGNDDDDEEDREVEDDNNGNSDDDDDDDATKGMKQ